MNFEEQKALVADLACRFTEKYPAAERVLVTIENGVAYVDVRFVVPYQATPEPDANADRVKGRTSRIREVLCGSQPALPPPPEPPPPPENTLHSDWGPYR